MSPKAAAERTGFSRQTIANAIHDRELHATKNNLDHWRIAEEDLDAWLIRRGPKQNVKDNSEATDNASEDVSHSTGANSSQNASDVIHTLTQTLQSQAEEIGRLTALLDTRDSPEIARLTAETTAKDERIADLRDQLDRIRREHTEERDRERGDHAAERERREAEHRETVEHLRAEIADLRRPWYARLFRN